MHSSRMRTARSSSCLLGGVCLSACWDTPCGCGPGDPPGCGPEDNPPGCGPGDLPRPDPSTSPLGVGLETPQARPLNFPLGVGLETPPGQTPQLPPWVWAWRPARHAGIPHPPDLQGMLGYHLQCMLGYPPVNRILDTLLKILPCPNFVAAVKIIGYSSAHLSRIISIIFDKLGSN